MLMLWQVRASLESLQLVQDMVDAKPPTFEFVNRRAMMKPLSLDGAMADRDGRSDRITPIIRITSPDFALDYFDWGLSCASARLRAALGDVGGCMRFRPLDVSGSSPAVVEQAYEVLEVTASADPIDETRTPGEVIDVPGLDGKVSKEWIIGLPAHGDRVFWREDFVPPAPMFRVKGTPWVLATDALADRVMRAGIKDVVFQDLTSNRAQTEVVLRQM